MSRLYSLFITNKRVIIFCIRLEKYSSKLDIFGYAQFWLHSLQIKVNFIHSFAQNLSHLFISLS